jgi:hypothetical protein
LRYLRAEGFVIQKNKKMRRELTAMARMADARQSFIQMLNDPEARGKAKRLQKYHAAKSDTEKQRLLKRANFGASLLAFLEADEALSRTKMDGLRRLIDEGRAEADYNKQQRLKERKS